MQQKYTRTQLFIINEELWKWAKFQSELLGLGSVSEYVFKLIKDAKEGENEN